jgi:acetyltransferase-like isoleucine patch superfamily enzyme
MGRSVIDRLLSHTRFTRDLGPAGGPIHNGLVVVGEHTYGADQISPHIWNMETRLIIGSYCSIADNVHVLLGGNHRVDRVSSYPFGRDAMKAVAPEPEANPVSNGDVVIGSDVWVGSHASIMSGVTIGSGAVVAAYAHVVRDVEPYSIVGGNPARHLRHRFAPEVVERLIKIAWWEWPSSVVFEKRSLLSDVPTGASLAAMDEVSVKLRADVSEAGPIQPG